MNVTCPHCGGLIDVQEEWIGQTVNCPHESCAKEVFLPPDLLQGQPSGSHDLAEDSDGSEAKMADSGEEEEVCSIPCTVAGAAVDQPFPASVVLTPERLRVHTPDGLREFPRSSKAFETYAQEVVIKNERLRLVCKQRDLRVLQSWLFRDRLGEKDGSASYAKSAGLLLLLSGIIGLSEGVGLTNIFGTPAYAVKLTFWFKDFWTYPDNVQRCLGIEGGILACLGVLLLLLRREWVFSMIGAVGMFYGMLWIASPILIWLNSSTEPFTNARFLPAVDLATGSHVSVTYQLPWLLLGWKVMISVFVSTGLGLAKEVRMRTQYQDGDPFASGRAFSMTFPGYSF